MPLERASIESIFTQSWTQRGLLSWLLLPVSLLFRCVVAVRHGMYAAGLLKGVQLPVPVIVVGNIFVGGTGKTPLTIWLTQALQQAGYVPGIISRGYGAQNDVPQEVKADSLPQRVGDEPVLIARRTGSPIFVGRNRVAAARALLAAHPEVNVIVSDDGLQHYALKRDIEIVLFDARGTGNGWMLPSGPLREPVSRRRDFTIVNAQQVSADMPRDAIRMKLAGEIAEQLSEPSRTLALHGLAQSMQEVAPKRIIAAAGIGNPLRFFTMLRGIGLDFEEMPLPDHYDFAVNPFAAVSADIILITEKDAVKCSRIDALKNDPRLWVVPVTAHIDGALAEKIVEKLRGYPTA